MKIDPDPHSDLALIREITYRWTPQGMVTEIVTDEGRYVGEPLKGEVTITL